MADIYTQSRKPRRVAIVHYHLRLGGVTTVIEHTLAGLMAFAEMEVVILSGEPYSRKGLANVQVVPGLAYGADVEADELAESMREAAKAGLEGQLPDIWHCHNHALGKNRHLPGALGRLARGGQRLLLQMHDFAEDGRPENYRLLKESAPAYPDLASVHYATINSRDHGLLKDADLSESKVHALSNPVMTHQEDRLETSHRPIVLYATRGIRRKNLGEMVLLAAVARDGAFFATTRVPENPAWLKVHDEWASFAKERGLPAAFGVVGKHSPLRLKIGTETGRSMKAWSRSATCALTTSVSEGFGLAFVESLLDGLPLLGRDLPEITKDFENQGLTFPGLYRALRVPLAWIDEDEFEEELETQLVAAFEAYHQDLPTGAVSRAFAAMVDAQGRIDFGRLSEKFQREVIDHLLKDPSLAESIIVETPGALVDIDLWLDSWFEEGLEIPTLNEQRRLLRKTASPRAYTGRLVEVYESLVKEPAADARAVLESDVSEHLVQSFLAPERFQILRS